MGETSDAERRDPGDPGGEAGEREVKTANTGAGGGGPSLEPVSNTGTIIFGSDPGGAPGGKADEVLDRGKVILKRLNKVAGDVRVENFSFEVTWDAVKAITAYVKSLENPIVFNHSELLDLEEHFLAIKTSERWMVDMLWKIRKALTEGT